MTEKALKDRHSSINKQQEQAPLKSPSKVTNTAWQHVKQVGLPLPPVMQATNSYTLLFQDALLVSPSGKGLKLKGKGMKHTDSQKYLH
jgi:hypothetical protein